MDTNSIFEIRDTDINVEEIRKRIQKELKKRGDIADYPPDPALIEKNELLQKNNKIKTGGDFQRDFYYVNTWWDINNSGYQIKSHHPYIGKFLVQGREIVNGEVRRYVDPMITRQSEFNASVTRILNEYSNQLTALHDQFQVLNTRIIQQEQKNDTILDRIRVDFTQVLDNVQEDNEKSISELKKEINVRILEDHENTVSALKSEINLIIQENTDHQKNLLKSFIESLVQQRIHDAMIGMDSDIRSKVWLEKILTDSISNLVKKIEMNCDPENFQSQDNFHFNEIIGKAWITESGEPSNSPNVFEDAASLFESCHNVLDIGCGQGYFLSLLKSRGIGSYGIDTNQVFSSYGEQQGITILTADAISHLTCIDNESLDGIFISQLIEHLTPHSIFSLLTYCYRKMMKGSSLVIITPNILSVQVSSNLFYMDPSHKTHVHPEVLKYILNYCGFSEIREKFYNSVPDDHKLRLINETDIEENSRQLCHLFNYNIEFLNKVLFGHRDYAMIVKK